MRIAAALTTLASAALLTTPAHAIDPQRSWRELVSSNGFTGVVVSLETRRMHHFREHLFATEEPRWNAAGDEVWSAPPGSTCFKPESIYSRDLLRDAYFGIRAGGVSTWLTEVPVNEDGSGYDAPTGATGNGGTPIIRMVQELASPSLRATTRVFAPWQYGGSGYLMALEVTNTGASAIDNVVAYGLVNPNTGSGRPGPRQEIGADFETVTLRPDGSVVEQGFAGVIGMIPLPAATVATHTPAPFFDHVRLNNAGALPTPATSPLLGNEQASAFEWQLGRIEPGASRWVAVLVAHDPNPDFVDGRLDAMREFIDGRTADELVDDERDYWRDYLAALSPPPGMSADEQAMWRHSAAILRSAQVREEQYWVRPLADTGKPRFTGIDGDVVAVGGDGTIREHRGRGALLASLPPGEWAYAWVRDGSYGIVGMTDAGMHVEARLALEFFLRAHANRYVDFEELDAVPLRDYALSLTRYHGFGIEESDTICNGDLNFEWDGFGLYLWALRHYVEATGDTTLLDEYWDVVAGGIGDVIEGLILPETGLMHPDSSIWEVHWFGKEKTFAYTSITAARGLCDAAWLAAEQGDTVRAERFEQSGRALRAAIAERLTTPSGAIASNTEELAAGSGYWDAAVVEAVAMGLFDPDGRIATATLDAIETNLTVPSGRGVFRNDDNFDSHGLTPWGSFYDSQEWVFLDYRVSMAERLAGNNTRASFLQDWVRDQTLLNFLLIGENYDENTGAYRNNAPMIGFGAGSYITAMKQRAGLTPPDIACGMYWEDDPIWGPTDEPTDPGAEPTDAGADAGIPDVGPDASDASEPDDVPDTTDASDVPDELDVPDTTDASDVPDELDVPDTTDASDVPDELDVPVDGPDPDGVDDTTPDDTTPDDTSIDATSPDTGSDVTSPDTGTDTTRPPRDSGTQDGGSDASIGGGGGGGCSAAAPVAASGFAPMLLGLAAVLGGRRRRGG